MQAFDPTALRGDRSSVRFEPGPTEDKLILSLGPQHPSTHGVLRIMVELDGEYILRAEPILGYIHRMHEWMAEQKTYAQYMPNMGRVDYLHAMAWNWAYAGAVERLAGIEVPERAEYIRVVVAELNRISSHLVWWGAYLLDLGAFTPIMRISSRIRSGGVSPTRRRASVPLVAMRTSNSARRDSVRMARLEGASSTMSTVAGGD